jgi:hypothetical protein
MRLGKCLFSGRKTRFSDLSYPQEIAGICEVGIADTWRRIELHKIEARKKLGGCPDDHY